MTKILVIDDLDEARVAIAEMLTREGYEVIDAANGKEGLKMVEKHAPDVVVSDILMPEMDGIGFLREIRKSKPHLPVIAFTASFDLPYLKAAQTLGAVHVLHKPFLQAEIVSAVREALQMA